MRLLDDARGIARTASARRSRGRPRDQRQPDRQRPRALAGRPDQQGLLREDPSPVPNAVEELLRFDAPVQLVGRLLGEPLVDDRGATVPAGSQVALLLGGANRDPAVFADPDVLDVTRGHARLHLAFTSGHHDRLGASLVRLEGEIAFATLLDRSGTLTLAAADPTTDRRAARLRRGPAARPDGLSRVRVQGRHPDGRGHLIGPRQGS